MVFLRIKQAAARFRYPILVLLAIIVVAAGIYLASLYRYQSALVWREDRHLPAGTRAEIISRVDNFKSEILSLEASRQNPQKLFSLYDQLSGELVALGEYSEALSYIKKAQKLQPENSVGYEDAYQVYVLAGDENQARVAIKKAVALNPASPNNWVNYIGFEQQFFNADLKALLELSKQAQEKTNHAGVVMNQYGLLLERDQQYEEAYKVFRELFLSDQGNQAYFQNLDRVNIILQKMQLQQK